MQAIVTIILGAAGVAAMFFVAALLSTFFGGMVGFCVDLAFTNVVPTVNKLLGTTLTGFDLGAMLGFVGSFFRSNQTNTAK